MKAVRHFPVMAGCKLSEEDAAKLQSLAHKAGRPRGVILRDLVRRARLDDLELPVDPAPEEAIPTPD